MSNSRSHPVASPLLLQTATDTELSEVVPVRPSNSGRKKNATAGRFAFDDRARRLGPEDGAEGDDFFDGSNDQLQAASLRDVSLASALVPLPSPGGSDAPPQGRPRQSAARAASQAAASSSIYARFPQSSSAWVTAAPALSPASAPAPAQQQQQQPQPQQHPLQLPPQQAGSAAGGRGPASPWPPVMSDVDKRIALLERAHLDQLRANVAMQRMMQRMSQQMDTLLAQVGGWRGGGRA